RKALNERAAALGLPPPAPWQLRDIRRSVISAMKELGVALEVREQAVNHSLRGLRAVYEQADLSAEVRAALDAWAARVEQIVTEDRVATELRDMEGASGCAIAPTVSAPGALAL